MDRIASNDCARCGVIGSHVASDHPLPNDHADYDAFYDATDEDLAAMARDHIVDLFGERE